MLKTQEISPYRRTFVSLSDETKKTKKVDSVSSKEVRCLLVLRVTQHITNDPLSLTINDELICFA